MPRMQTLLVYLKTCFPLYTPCTMNLTICAHSVRCRSEQGLCEFLSFLTSFYCISSDCTDLPDMTYDFRFSSWLC